VDRWTGGRTVASRASGRRPDSYSRDPPQWASRSQLRHEASASISKSVRLTAHLCRGVDLDLAVPAIAWTRLMSGGQSRMSGGHLYVERSLAAEFVDRMHHCVGFLDVDDPCRPCTISGH